MQIKIESNPRKLLLLNRSGNLYRKYDITYSGN